MAQSTEYPDLQFVRPKSYGVGRDGKAVRYAVIHYTAGSEGPNAAEDGAAYDARRTDGVSTHYFHDSNSTVQCVLTQDRANAAFHKGNRLGIQHEICGTIQTRAQWLDGVSDATLWNAAKQVARDCMKYGLPVRRLTASEVRAAWYSFPNGPKGICGHVDVTNAYPEDGGTHTDPGPEFPWDVFLDRVLHFVNGGVEADMAHAFESAEGLYAKLLYDNWAVETKQEWVDAGGDPAIYDLLALNGSGPNKLRLQLDAQDTALVKLGEQNTLLSQKIDAVEDKIDSIIAGVIPPEALIPALKAALADPEVKALLVEAAFEGSQQAETE